MDTTMMKTTSGELVSEAGQRLMVLAEQINAEHLGCEQSFEAGLQHAIKAGELLQQAKALCRHGEWGQWLELNCEFSVRTAQLYMKAAHELPALLASNTKRVAQLSFRKAMKLISAPKGLPAGFPHYDIHELGLIFPVMQAWEMEALVESIKARGLYYPITLYEGQILDGKCRYEACKIAGVIPTFQNYPECCPDYRGDALAYVMSANMYRAHYSEEQRALIAAQMEHDLETRSKAQAKVG